MDRGQITAEVAQIIRDVLELPALAVTERTTASDVAGWDSLNHINIIVAIEACFGIKFKTAEFERVKDVGMLIALIEEKLRLGKP
jgi:acyl carrier protein